MTHIFLIGYRGSGKTTVGRILAAKLHWNFIDTDEVIETEAACSIKSIFETEGEAGFRDREQRAVASAAAKAQPTVIGLGGGAILREANQSVIRHGGRCVWLKGTAESLYDRIRSDASSAARRPDLSSRGGYDEVVEMLATREPIYAQLAQKTVMTDGLNPDEIVAEIADWLNFNV